ncbi:MAG: 16S rRNA (guanine(966)-N(2))-methyltransferase RsmD [Syntrophomonadaceae bacterium]|nr:16S rRNA (guanine(966)-N(2))-methyltransferase RsmD [Syntrophomonadaceae bacterium]
MRVIAGKAKGRKLKAPAGLDTRPMTDRIKESLFSILGARVPGSRVLDLFAGSGAVGIEALSRGAAWAVFVDRDARAVGVLKENLGTCGMDPAAEVYRSDVQRALQVLEERGCRFDLVFLDPPFADLQAGTDALGMLDRGDLLERGATVVLRLPHKAAPPGGLERLRAVDARTYGESTLYFYEYGGKGEDGNGTV